MLLETETPKTGKENKNMRAAVCSLLLLLLLPLAPARRPASLLVAENNLKPWPSGHGEDPPPLGSLVRLDVAYDGQPNGTATAASAAAAAPPPARRVVATGLVDPVWVAGSTDGRSAFVGLFHTGEIVRVSLVGDAAVTVVATNLSCPEGVAVAATAKQDQGGNETEAEAEAEAGTEADEDVLYVVENPVGDECKAAFPTKRSAQLTRIDLRTGAQTKVAGLRSTPRPSGGGGGRGGRSPRAGRPGRLRVRVRLSRRCRQPDAGGSGERRGGGGRQPHLAIGMRGGPQGRLCLRRGAGGRRRATRAG